MKYAKRNPLSAFLLLVIFSTGCSDAKKEDCQQQTDNIDAAIDTYNASKTKSNCSAVISEFDVFLKNKNDCADKDSYANSYEAFVTATKNCQ